jgi:hypothetical protein
MIPRRLASNSAVICWHGHALTVWRFLLKALWASARG